MNSSRWKKGNIPYNFGKKLTYTVWNKDKVLYPDIEWKRVTLSNGRTEIRYKRLCKNCSKIEFVVTRYLKNTYCRSCAYLLTRRKMTIETIQKIRLKRIEQKNTNRDTSIELKVKEQLINNNIEFEQQFNLGNKFQCDFFIPKFNLIIECDGDYWHSRLDMKNRDKSKDGYAKACGYKLIRIKEHEINRDDFDIGEYIGFEI
jgi:very-short-patch-repair endonuclease